jgi:hypothetical protein
MTEKGGPFQAGLIALSSASSLALGFLTKNPHWYRIGLLSGAIIPFTISFLFFLVLFDNFVLLLVFLHFFNVVKFKFFYFF